MATTRFKYPPRNRTLGPHGGSPAVSGILRRDRQAHPPKLSITLCDQPFRHLPSNIRLTCIRL
jgi:hypothetical protein